MKVALHKKGAALLMGVVGGKRFSKGAGVAGSGGPHGAVGEASAVGRVDASSSFVWVQVVGLEYVWCLFALVDVVVGVIEAGARGRVGELTGRRGGAVLRRGIGMAMGQRERGFVAKVRLSAKRLQCLPLALVSLLDAVLCFLKKSAIYVAVSATRWLADRSACRKNRLARLHLPCGSFC